MIQVVKALRSTGRIPIAGGAEARGASKLQVKPPDPIADEMSRHNIVALWITDCTPDKFF